MVFVRNIFYSCRVIKFALIANAGIHLLFLNSSAASAVQAAPDRKPIPILSLPYLHDTPPGEKYRLKREDLEKFECDHLIKENALKASIHEIFDPYATWGKICATD
jgi:hypothetical protein